MPILLASLIRHLLTLAAGSLITVGVQEDAAINFVSAAEPVVGGIVLYSASQAWSLFDKNKKKK